MIYQKFTKPHLNDEELTCFIDGTCSDNDRARIVKHLKSCAHCSEAYREAVLYKGLWRSGVGDLEASEESIDLARRALDRVKKPASSPTFPAKYIRAITIAASIVIIVTFGISYHFTGRDGIPSLDQNHIAPIREAVESASMNGHFVIPGGERSIGTVPEAYRSGYVRINDSLRTALAYFAGEFQDEATSRAVMYWLLGGYIATGQINTARDLASEAIREFPADIDMMVFDAIVSYMEGDTMACERSFRQVLAREPGNPYANLNLAVLLSERGDESGALVLLEYVAQEHSDSPFAARARRISEEIRESHGQDF